MCPKNEYPGIVLTSAFFDTPTPLMSGSVNAALSVALLVAYAIKKYLAFYRQPAPYPPGPKGLPLIGNAFDFPTRNIGQEYARWSAKYGSTCSLLVFATGEVDSSV